ncbi:MAG: TonB-dependent receptor plug domain-containing protein [Gemmatimonadaceae bacterium]
MLSLSPRVLLCLGLFVGLASACARAKKTSGGENEVPAPEGVPRTSTVTSEDIKRAPGEPIEQLLMARTPGVWIMRTPDGGISVRIRGTTSVYGNNEPLYVVDGIAIQAGPGGSLTGINPYDIESINVLKDAASTSMYGARGANGVIVIKTKRPGR